MNPKNKATTILFIFLLVFLPAYPRANSAGYGEENENLGQFTDEFQNVTYVNTRINIERNSSLNAMELNITTSPSYGNYTHYMMITIKSDRINSNLTDFPVFIKISDSSGTTDRNITKIFDEIGNSYQKIAITDSSFSYEYYVEVEQWSLTDRLGGLWISVNVSSSEDIILYFHYDSTATNNTARVDIPGSLIAQNVWDDNFIAVYHMRDQATNTILDSTDSNLDGVKTAANRPEEINGLLGFGQEFDPNERVDLPNYPGAYTNVSMESWFQADDTDNNRVIFSLSESDNQIDRVMHILGADLLYNYFRTDGATVNPSIAFTDETNYHYFATARSGTAITGYLDGANDAGFNGVVGAGTIQDLTQNWIGTYSVGNALFFDGTIDELRFSDIDRIPEYFNATNFCGLDDLVEYGPLTDAMGYSVDGYFTTTDYLLNANGSVLVQLTNATIPEDTEITIQFSVDSSTWVDNEGNAGYNNIIDGFFALDLRDLNWSTFYYVRYNYSTLDNTITPRLYQSRLITTEGIAETITQNITGEWIYYDLTSINVTVGTHDSGDVNSTLDIDGDTFNCSEVVGAPGYIVSFNWTGVDPDAHCLWFVTYIFYDGSASHEIYIELWDFTASAWIEIGIIEDMIDFDWVNVTVYDLRLPDDFINSTGAVWGRFNHVDPGNINHDIHIDFLKLHAFIPSDVAPTTEDNYFWIFIAIVLSIITALLVWMKFGNQ